MPNTRLRRPQRGFRRGGGAGREPFHGGRSARTFTAAARAEATSADERWERTRMTHAIDETMGFARFEAGRRRDGWLVNVQPTSVPDERNPAGRAALDCYFIDDDGSTFKATVEYEPYFLLAARGGREAEVEEWVKRAAGGGGLVKTVRRIEREDLKMPNHLLGRRRTLLELRFANVTDLMAVRRDIMPIAEKNRKNMDAMDAYAEAMGIGGGAAAPTGAGAEFSGEYDLFDADANDGRGGRGGDEDDRPTGAASSIADASDHILDIREYDVPYHVRVMIDLDIRVGKWYHVDARHGLATIVCDEKRLAPADPVVLAFDIETTKLPLKFPDSAVDRIMMVSYMIDGQGFLVTNREVVSEDIADFEYTPKPEFPGQFMIFNEPDERALLDRFLGHIREARPTVIATYNGDFFDWPFVDARAAANGIDLYRETGWRRQSSSGSSGEDQYGCAYSVHMDCLHWVNRDSYLPQGSRGLKAVTVAKLGYDPDELDPELMLTYAAERPQTLAEYSVSDAVATYYLYMKYVHPFIFSLCTIIPLGGDDVLRKGTGTLCEMLLMVQAYRGKIVLPNKHTAPREAFWDGHLLDSETYVGGHVESIEAGVFRADIPVSFAIDPTAVDDLLRDLDAALKFSITVEAGRALDEVDNYDEVRDAIKDALDKLRETPTRIERPLIYHLDVASMYPNIMTTNRLQPDSMISEADCAACDFNRPGKTCDRRLPWAWRGEYLPAKRDEYNMIRRGLEAERFPFPPGSAAAAAATAARLARGSGGVGGGGGGGGGGAASAPTTRPFRDLSAEDQAALIRKRLQLYSQKVYHKIRDSTTVVREAVICQRENPFYIDTVRDFRDRRYEYKGQAKTWKGKADAAAAGPDREAARKMVVLYDSLQLAHKVILNSFYGYVMRKGSRWYSMEMAGVTCLTGATIIQVAKELVERVGRPLELDTDGIWCMLPAGFPENFSFKLKGGAGRKLAISYPCVMLNHRVHAKFTNGQYQTLANPATHRYDTRSENSIFFEVDGPYRAMVLPTSKEEDKNLKKRYAVFGSDGRLAELKGFEVKRRGELKLVKIFQQQIFGSFLEGRTLAECYQATAIVANRWLDVLQDRGRTLADEELMDLISENRSMSRTLAEYGTQKSTSITTARRLADFLGEQMVRDRGLNCRFVIASRPRGAPVTERAVPVAIFSAEDATRRAYLRKWLREEPADTDPRSLIDWNYYTERLGSVIQKLITIPAALQKVPNPVPRVPHPDWLQRRINTREDRMKQTKLTDMFPVRARPTEGGGLGDIEDGGSGAGGLSLLKPKPIIAAVAAAVASSSQKRKSPLPPPSQPDRDPFAALPAIMPSPSEDYVGFLEYQKQKWRIQRQARIHRRQLFGGADQLQQYQQQQLNQRHQGTIQHTFMRQAHTMLARTWQLLQLAPTDSPGVVRAFALIDAKIHALKIRVPRQVYVNLRGGGEDNDEGREGKEEEEELPDIDVDGCEAEQVGGGSGTHALPGGRTSGRLFRLTVPEDVYQREEDRFAALFEHPSVEGVYERQVPLHVRALLLLGNACTLDPARPPPPPAALARSLDEGFDLAALARAAAGSSKRSTMMAPPPVYLEGAALAYIHLAHIAAVGDRHMFAVFSAVAAGEEGAAEAQVVILQPERGAGQDLPNVGRIYADANRQQREQREQPQPQQPPDPSPFPYPDRLAVKVVQSTTRRRALLEVADAIKRMRRAAEAARRPAVLVVQSPQRALLLAARELPSLAALAAELPVLPLRSDPADGALPPLGWQATAARRLVGHFLGLGSWIGHLTALARHGDVPLCNLERAEDPRFLIDVAYARRLQAAGAVLWWSPAPRPDYGGHERDDVSGAMTTTTTTTSSSLSSVVANNPGTFASVCIDLEIRNLAVNTILTSSLAGSEASFEDGVADNDDPLLSAHGAVAAPAVAVLRDMVKAWWADACRGSAMADVLVQHLVRWVEGPDSFMFDPALRHHVRMLCRRSLRRLLADFRRVGAQAVFASPNRLILQTTKADVGAAIAYGEYVTRSIKTRPAFHFVDLEIREYWDYLVWYDEHNYGGKGWQAGQAMNGSDGGGGGNGGDGGSGGGGSGGGGGNGGSPDQQMPLETGMHWQMATFLPVRLRPVFQDWVAEFVELMHSLKLTRDHDDGPSQTPRLTPIPMTRDPTAGVSDIPIITGKPFEKPMKKAIAGLIAQQKREMLHPELAGDYSFPVLPGSHAPPHPKFAPSSSSLSSTTAPPADGRRAVLELVKALMQVLSLDKNITLEARILRRDLLAMLDVREFSREAGFTNPSESLRLAQVSCDSCTMARDLDLCRDEALVLAGDGTDGGSRDGPWRCAFCEAEYDRNGLEERLVAGVEALAVEWATQDLRCGRCGTLRLNEFAEHCTCSGEWEPVLRRDDAVRRLGVHEGVAKYYALKMLTDAVGGVKRGV